MKYKSNGLRERLQSGKKIVGTWAQISSPDIVEMQGAAGFDFTIIDLEHGSFYFETAVQMLRAADAAGIVPVVRVPDKNTSVIMRILDAGAMGVLVPGVGSKSDAEEVVAAVRYSPLGNRGACPGIRAAGHFAENWPEFVAWSNENVLVWLLVEGTEGIDHFDEILEVPGINAIMMGPFDLSQAMGYPGQTSHPAVVEKLQMIVKKAQAKGIDMVVVPFARTPEDLRHELNSWLDMGCRIFTAGSDKRILAVGLKSAVMHVRAIL